MTLEQRAHDLAMLYMQMEFGRRDINPTGEDDFHGFTDEYWHCYFEILQHLEEEV